jgi:hypothetical protein
MENSPLGSQGSKDPTTNPVTSFKDNNQQLLRLAASSITQLFSNNNHAYDEGYAQGRQDAYEDVFKWFTYQHDSSLRNVSVVSFFNFINDKLNSTKSKFAQRKFPDLLNPDLASNNDNNMDDVGGHINNLSRSVSDQNSQSDNKFPQTNHLLRRVNVNLDNINISDNRKRRPAPFRFTSESMDENDNGDGDNNNAQNTTCNLPFNLRNGHTSLNPFAVEANDDDRMVYLPKRKKMTGMGVDFNPSSGGNQ